MARLTEASAVLAPKRRVSSDTSTTGSFIFGPSLRADLNGAPSGPSRLTPLLCPRAATEGSGQYRCPEEDVEQQEEDGKRCQRPAVDPCGHGGVLPPPLQKV